MRWKWIDLELKPDFDTPSKFGSSHRLYRFTIKTKYGEETFDHNVPVFWNQLGDEDCLEVLSCLFDEALVVSPKYGYYKEEYGKQLQENLRNLRQLMYNLGFDDDFMIHVLNYNRGES